MKNEEDDECISKFGHYCLMFYSSSLILNSSTSSLNNEEKKADDDAYNINTSNDKKKNDQAVGKILIETLDRINTIHSMLQQQQHQYSDNDAIVSSIANLKQEHTIISKQYHEVLFECELLDINQFIESSSSGIRDNDTPSLLQRYNIMRDSMRQRAHQISSLHRQNSLFELLSSTSSSFSSPLEEEDKPRLTQIENIQHTISIIQKFVNKYKANIGSHSFLAGLYKFIDLQINPKLDSKRLDPVYIVRWNFNGSVLTESCRSCIGKHNENESDELAYAREAIEVLFSFLIWIKDDIDLEGGVVNMMKPIDIHDLGQLETMDSSSTTYNTESMLSFEVDKNVSNYTLKRILSVLPNPKRLDARATGSLEVVSSVNLSRQRTNIEGKEDEHSWFGMMIRYFLEYFHII